MAALISAICLLYGGRVSANRWQKRMIWSPPGQRRNSPGGIRRTTRRNLLKRSSLVSSHTAMLAKAWAQACAASATAGCDALNSSQIGPWNSWRSPGAAVICGQATKSASLLPLPCESAVLNSGMAMAVSSGMAGASVSWACVSTCMDVVAETNWLRPSPPAATVTGAAASARGAAAAAAAGTPPPSKAAKSIGPALLDLKSSSVQLPPVCGHTVLQLLKLPRGYAPRAHSVAPSATAAT
mmetsp:Transcript_67306/g.194689  ORF Transcript_67306/g.194689 Transcript_67306/m.194689 type:complete len:240 (-) Transcript_67306:111-830(-)